MKSLFHPVLASVALAGALVVTGCASPSAPSVAEAPQNQSTARPEDDPSQLLPAHTYELEGAFEVDGRQGLAFEDETLWVSGSTTLSRYSAAGELLATNDTPFDAGYEREVNHIGDIDVWDGEVYAGVELFLDGEATNIQKWLRTSGITAGIPVAAPLHHMDERLMHPEDRGTRWRRVMQAD